MPEAGRGIPSLARRRAFVRRHTRLEPVAGLPDVRLHVAADVSTVMAQAGAELGDPDPAIPFWAFPWAGGLALARHLLAHPEEVADRDVLDLASGSGLCAIAAQRAGAATVTAADVDPFAEAAVELNARANGVRIAFERGDLLDAPPPAVDVILAGDVCYEETMARRMVAWLTSAAGRGTRVLLGDPGRAYLPAGLRTVASYRVPTSRELEADDARESRVFEIPPA